MHIFICTTSKKSKKNVVRTFTHLGLYLHYYARHFAPYYALYDATFPFFRRFLDGQEPKKSFMCTTSKKNCSTHIYTRKNLFAFLHTLLLNHLTL